MLPVSTRAFRVTAGAYRYVTAIGQAAHYSRNPVLFQEFRKMMGHFLLSQLIQFGTILLQDKRADIATRLLTFPSIMGVLLAQANLSKLIFPGFGII